MIFLSFYAIFLYLSVIIDQKQIRKGDSGQNLLSHSLNSETPLRKDSLRKGAFHALYNILYLQILQFLSSADGPASHQNLLIFLVVVFSNSVSRTIRL